MNIQKNIQAPENCHKLINNKLVTLDKNRFRTFLQDGRDNQLTQSGCLTMNWVPMMITTGDDMEFAVRKNSTVILFVSYCFSYYFISKALLEITFRMILKATYIAGSS